LFYITNSTVALYDHSVRGVTIFRIVYNVTYFHFNKGLRIVQLLSFGITLNLFVCIYTVSAMTQNIYLVLLHLIVSLF
jgi:hypothetical protein